MYQAKNYDHLLGTAGFSDTLLKNHFTLYGGYVANTNKILEILVGKEPGTPEYAELKRRFGWEWNGMKLHELYFGNMKKGGGDKSAAGEIVKKIEEQFGSYENWEKDFKGVGAMRGIGWVILYYAEHSRARTNAESKGRLFNVWVNEHDVGHLAGATPLLVMDVFEHAFVLDYGLKRADYINAFFGALDWEEVERRLVKK